MSVDPVAYVPAVAGLAYAERLRDLPESFTATLIPETGNRYNLTAIALCAPDGRKIGYVAPEVAREWHEVLLERSSRGERITCPARRAGAAARETSGVELYLDFSRLSGARS